MEESGKERYNLVIESPCEGMNVSTVFSQSTDHYNTSSANYLLNL